MVSAGNSGGKLAWSREEQAGSPLIENLATSHTSQHITSHTYRVEIINFPDPFLKILTFPLFSGC